MTKEFYNVFFIFFYLNILFLVGLIVSGILLNYVPILNKLINLEHPKTSKENYCNQLFNINYR